MKDNNTRRILLPRIHRAPRRHPKTQRRIAHAQHDNTRMFGRIIGDPTQMRLDHMVAIQKRQFAIRFNPHLVLCMLRQIVQRRDVETELARLAKLAETRSQGHEVGTGDGDGESHRGLRDAVDAVAMQAEHVRVIGTVDEVYEVLADVVGELFEERFRFFFCERSHCA